MSKQNWIKVGLVLGVLLVGWMIWGTYSGINNADDPNADALRRAREANEQLQKKQGN